MREIMTENTKEFIRRTGTANVTMSDCLAFMSEHGLVMRTFNDSDRLIIYIGRGDFWGSILKFSISNEDLRALNVDFVYILAVKLIEYTEVI